MRPDSRLVLFGERCDATDSCGIAKRLMAVYEVDATIVDGDEGGFLMKRISREER